MEIKLLKYINLIFVPQTVAEAVLVKDNSVVKRLDEVLKSKNIIVPDNSGLVSEKTLNGIIITHSNKILLDNTLCVRKFSYDDYGHITTSLPVSSLKILVGNNSIEYSGNEEQTLKFGDDFLLSQDKNLELTWGDI